MIQRTGFDITVAGADKAVAQFNAVTQAEKRAGEEGVKAGKGIDAATAGGASGFKALGNAVDSFLKPLRIAANILPGLGIGGIFLGAYEAVKAFGGALVDAFGPDSDAVKGMGLLTQATKAYEDQLTRVEKKVRDVAAAQVAVGRNALASFAGVSGDSITGGVLAAQFGSQSAALDARRKLLDEQAAQIAADERALQERAARYGNLPAGTAALPALETEVLSAAREIGKRKAAFREQETKLHDEVVDFRRTVRQAVGDFGPDTARGGARGGKGPKDVSEDEIYSVIYGGRNGPAYKQPVPTSDYAAVGNLGRASQDVIPPDLKPDAQQRFADKLGDIWQNQIPSAVDFGAEAIRTAADAIGGAFTDMIIGGDRVKGGIGRMFGEILAGQSKMLFGLALTAEFLAAAAAIVQIPIFGYTAPQAAGAGAVFAAGGVALALAARALGAGSAPGGGHASGGGGGGYGGGAGGYLHNPYSGGQSDTHVTVVIGGEVVTRGVTAETRRIERRGGITEPRLARAQ